MKQKKTLLAAFAIAALSYGNLNAQNFEVSGSTPTGVSLPPQVGARLNGNGLITQLSTGTEGSFTTADRWSSFGTITTFSQTLTGFRAQGNGLGVTLGTTTNGNIPFLEWGATGQPNDFSFKSFDNPTSPTSSIEIMRLSRANRNVIIMPRTNALSLPLNRASLEVYSGAVPNPSSVTTLPSAIFSIGGIYSVTQGTNENDGTPQDYAAGIVGDASNAIVNQTSFGVLGIGENSLTGTAGLTYGVYSVGNLGYTGSLYQVSDKKFKKDIKTENTLLDKILKINVVNYTFDKNNKATKHLAFPSKLQHGVLSQELEAIFPELVSIVNAPSPVDEKGKAINPISYKGVEYMQLIPILIKGMQEQQAQIETLTKQLTAKTSETFVLQNNATESEKQIVKANAFSLSQNAPNPFSEKTTITYTVPTNVKKAMLGVFDLNGKMLLQYNLQTGKNQLIVNGNTLTAGMYLYTLIADGEEVLSKRMILTR